jgi:hypothetical protein
LDLLRFGTCGEAGVTVFWKKEERGWAVHTEVCPHMYKGWGRSAPATPTVTCLYLI